MTYNNEYTGPLVLTVNNDPSHWRTNSHRQRLDARRNAARTRKNKPGITNTIKKWFGAKPAAAQRRSRSRSRRRSNNPRIMYE
uniref:Uncharacterized protein n=1 Tax=viral metagenome TaxID=1070528 RepID=A0A6C0LPV8_9ZZZZ